jgi:class 3 adenylate cyclase/tetratricopeptide (TPR) repeat protein
MKCSRCQHENPPALKFCGECGARLAAVCASCGAANAPEQKFCGECGSKLSADTAKAKLAAPDSYTPKHLAEKILTSKAALEGERKQVTVLFADLKGSMELLADRDPEEARKLLDPVLERMMEAVHHYEGTVNQVMGDGIMALFGAPLAHEDHAVRSCYAALRMQEAINRYSDELQRAGAMPVQIRVGLNSGEVVVRSIGSDLHMDYTAVGQTTHLASRIEQLARAGSTLLSAETLGLAEGYVQVKPLGKVPVKGLTEPVEVFELTGVGSARSRLQASAVRGLTKFVGRTAEMEALHRALDHAAQGHGQVVSVVGEPGVGKSRLYYEFTHSHRTQGWLILEASSVSYGKATPYLPAIDLLKGYFRIGERDDQRAIREKVTGKLLTLDRALDSIIAPLAALLGLSVPDPAWNGLDPPRRRRETLDALKRLFLREAQAQPLILMFEDLHWTDSETQAFLDSLVDSLPGARLLLLTNFRPEYRNRWGAKSCFTQLRVDALPPESAEELLGALLGTDPAFQPLRRLLIARTEGNPFILEESVRTLLETGVLEGQRGAYRLAKPVDTIQVPPTAQALLAARIDRLSPQNKGLLQTAAVIGKDVPYLLLREIAGLAEDDLRQRLAELQGAEFVYETSLFPDLEYTFKHAFTHEVAYGSLLQERRRELHGRIVQGLERLYAERLEDQAERLAHHAEHAELWDKALPYLRQAALKAFARSANREAAAAFERALMALSRLPQTREAIEQSVDLRLELRQCLLPMADWQGSVSNARAAEEMIHQLGDPRREALIYAYLAGPINTMGDLQSGTELAHRAMAIAQSLKDPAVQIIAGYFVGQSAFLSGDYRQALTSYSRDVGLDADAIVAKSLEDIDVGLFFRSAATNLVLGEVDSCRCYAELGEFDGAFAHGQKAVRIAEKLGLLYLRLLGESHLGFAKTLRGQFEASIPLLERCLQTTQDAGLILLRLLIGLDLGRAYNLVGRSDEAIAMLEPVLAIADATQSVRWGQIVLAQLAVANGAMGRCNRATELGEEAVVLARRHHMRGHEAWALYGLGAIQAACHPTAPRLAGETYLQAHLLAKELGMRPLIAHCSLGLGRMYADTGDHNKAREHLTTALCLYRKMGMQFWLEKAEVVMRQLG